MKQFEHPVVIVLAYNKHDMTHACIESLHAHTRGPLHIILVDNGSTPAFEPSEKYELLRLEQNLFYTGGINAGIRHALRTGGSFENLVLLNNDVLVQDGWLEYMLKAAKSSVGIVGNCQLLEGENANIIHAGTADLLQGVHKGGPDNGLFDQETDEVWVTFACTLITRKCIEAIGLLDERMVHFYSDNDLCIRAWMAGFRVVFEPKSRVIHKHHASYKDSGVDPRNDQATYVDKWMGKDIQEKVFNKIFLDFDERSIMTVNPKIVRKSGD